MERPGQVGLEFLARQRQRSASALRYVNIYILYNNYEGSTPTSIPNFIVSCSRYV